MANSGKSISLVTRETKQQLVSTVNESGLPIDLLVYIVKDLYEALLQKSDEIYKSELKSNQQEKGSEEN